MGFFKNFDSLLQQQQEQERQRQQQMNPFTAGPRTIMSPYQPQKSSPIPQPQIPWTAGMPGMQSPPQQRPAPQRTGQRPTPTPINPLNIPMPPRGVPTTADFAQGLALPGVDDSSSAYSDQLVAANGQMPAGGFQNDPAAAAYPGASGFQQGTGVARQPQAGEKATGDTAQPTGTEGAFGLGFSNMDWVRLGGSLLAGSQPGGAGWAAPTEALGQITGEKENKKRYDAEQARQAAQDAMQKEMFALQKGEAQYTADQRDRLVKSQGELVASLQGTNPELAAAIKNMGAEQFGTFYGQRLLANEDAKAKELLTQREWDHQDSMLGRQLSSQERIARIGAANENNVFKAFQTKDAGMIADRQQEAVDIDTKTLPAMRTLLQNIKQAGQYEDATGQIIPANLRVKLSRVFNGSTGERVALDTWAARTLQPAIAMFAGTGPMATQELELAMKSFANPDMDLGSAVELVEEMIAQKERVLNATNGLSEYYSTYGGITRPTVPGAPPVTQWMKDRLQDTGFTPGQAGRDERAAAAGMGATPAAPAAPRVQMSHVGDRKPGKDGKFYVMVKNDPGPNGAPPDLNPNNWQEEKKPVAIKGKRVGGWPTGGFSRN